MKFFCKFIFIALIPITLSASPYSRRSRISKDLDVFEQNEVSYRKSILKEEKTAIDSSPSEYYTSSYHKREKLAEPVISQFKEDKKNSSEVKTFDFEFGASTGYMSGETTYHISFNNPLAIGGHGESKLEFPIDNYLIGLNAALTLRDRDFVQKNGELRKRSKIGFKWLTNLNKKSGKMKDSDWIENDINYITWYNSFYGTVHATSTNDGLDIYSESDTELEMDIFDFSYTHDLFLNDRFSFSPLIGYYYRDMHFTASNTVQYGYGPYAPIFTTTVSGIAIEYDVSYKFFYFGFETDLIVKNDFNLDLRFAYSPWLKAKDKDVHVLRNISSTTSAQGDAYMLNLDGKWTLPNDWLLCAGLEYSDFDTDGFQLQSGGGKPKNKVFQATWLASLGLNHSF